MLWQCFARWDTNTMSTNSESARPAFYTVKEAAAILRIGASTLYRIIREGDFPAVRLRSRYVVPAAVLDRILADVAESGGLVDPSRTAADRRIAREIGQSGGAW